MVKYLFKRLLWLILLFFLLTLVGFILMISTPGDPVLYRMGKSSTNAEHYLYKNENLNEYKKNRISMGLDLPIFYLGIQPVSVPDTLHKITSPNERACFERMCLELGNTELIEHYRTRIKTMINTFKFDTTNKYIPILLSLNQLLERTDEKVFLELLLQINNIEDPFTRSRGINAVHNLRLEFQQIHLQKKIYRVYMPKIIWHGANNQYHIWLKGWLIGDWGRSYHDNKPIRQKITEAWQWTFLLNIISFILVIVIAIPMGAILVYEKNHIIESIFIFIYSIPTFWLATFMLIFLCSGDYLTWFPAGGIQDIFYDENWSWWRKVANRTWHLVLPVIALSLPSLAYLTRQTGINIQNEMESDYIRTALAKGLSMNMTILKHAFRNALLPLIHWLGNGIPALVGGGIFIEIIFSIPGMGTLLYEAITTRDYPTIISIFNFMVLATLIGQLLADVLYYYFDPRIRFSIQSK